ncbi:MAG: GNAT family N-acetyltransferase [Nocardioidaceae bacterium]
MSTSLRSAARGDWAQFWPLLAEMGVPDQEQDCLERFEVTVEDPNWLVLVAARGERLIGYAAVQDYGDHLRCGKRGRVARLHDLFVAPEERWTGVGRALMDEAVEWARGRVGYLQWQAHETRSAPFYERLGFRGQPCPQPDYPEFEVTF